MNLHPTHSIRPLVGVAAEFGCVHRLPTRTVGDLRWAWQMELAATVGGAGFRGFVLSLSFGSGVHSMLAKRCGNRYVPRIIEILRKPVFQRPAVLSKPSVNVSSHLEE